MERFVAILDIMPEYAKALTAFLNESREFPYRAIYFSSVDEVKSCVEQSSVAILLAAECFEKDVLLFHNQEELRVFWLSEEKKNRTGNVFYRYSSADMIRESLCRREQRNRRLSVFTVFSPYRSSGQKGIANGLMEVLSRSAQTAIFSLLPFDSYAGESGNGMSELLFYALQGKEKLTEYLHSVLHGASRVVSFGGVRHATDLWGLHGDALEALLCVLEEKTEVTNTVFLISDYNEAGHYVLTRSDRILVPVGGSREEEAVYEEFKRQLVQSGEQELISKCVTLPFGDDKESVGFLSMISEAVCKGGEVLEGNQGGAKRTDSSSAGSHERVYGWPD